MKKNPFQQTLSGECALRCMMWLFNDKSLEKYINPHLHKKGMGTKRENTILNKENLIRGERTHIFEMIYHHYTSLPISTELWKKFWGKDWHKFVMGDDPWTADFDIDKSFLCFPITVQSQSDTARMHRVYLLVDWWHAETQNYWLLDPKYPEVIRYKESAMPILEVYKNIYGIDIFSGSLNGGKTYQWTVFNKEFFKHIF